LSFFVVVTSYRWEVSEVFQSVEFGSEFTGLLNSGMTNQEDLNLVLMVVRNVLVSLVPETHFLVLSQCPIERFVSLATSTSNGKVVISVLDCVLEFSKLPLELSVSNEIVKLIASSHRRHSAFNATITAVSIWTFYHLIENNSLDFDEFRRLQCVELVQDGLRARVKSVLVATCRVISILHEKFDFDCVFDVSRILQLIDGEAAAAAMSALRSIVVTKRQIAVDLVGKGFFYKCFPIFERSDVLTKLSLIGVMAALIDVMDADAFASAISPSELSLFSIMWDLCLTGDDETIECCFSLMLTLFRRAIRCGLGETVRDGIKANFAFNWLDTAAVDNPVMQAILTEIFPLTE
jgi:hypothetical protein